jgi:hypothetical protein
VRYVHALVSETVIYDWNVIQYNVCEHLHGLHGEKNVMQVTYIGEMMYTGRKREKEVRERKIDAGERGVRRKGQGEVKGREINKC